MMINSFNLVMYMHKIQNKNITNSCFSVKTTQISQNTY